MHIGILLTGHAPDKIRLREGDYDRIFETMLAKRGFTFTTWAVVDGQFPRDVFAADGWLITGSRHGAYEELDWIASLEAFVRRAHHEQVPLVGVCFGHQIIAKALGGHVEKFKGGWIVGPQTYDFDGEPAKLNAWHQDQVTELPPGARTIATGPNCEHAAFVVGDYILTVQAHPEYGDEVINDLIVTRGPGVVPDELMASACERLGTGNDNGKIASRISAFFKERPHV